MAKRSETTDCGSISQRFEVYEHGDVPEDAMGIYIVDYGDDPPGWRYQVCFEFDGEICSDSLDEAMIFAGEYAARVSPAPESGSVFSDDDLRRVLEWHEEVRATCGISADDDNLRKRIVGALRNMECRSVDDELAEAKRLIWQIRHIGAQRGGAHELDRIMRLVDQYGATRSLDSGEPIEQESEEQMGDDA